MFLTSPIFKETSRVRISGRSLHPKKFYFQEYIPLASKNKLSQSKDKFEGSSCMSELQTLFNCLKKWDFDDLNCKVHHDKYTRCVEEAAQQAAEFNEAAKKGILGQGNKNLTISQKNRLMELYPQPDLGKPPNRKMKRLPSQSYADDLFRRKHLYGKAS